MSVAPTREHGARRVLSDDQVRDVTFWHSDKSATDLAHELGVKRSMPIRFSPMTTTGRGA